ncbi:MAG: RNA-protein complex protein Nop10 [Candidatus Bathyarchaeota archaeon]|nr:RNA-protein complex protein Nop10 [Candidatus Bathyarchaeota archaeon]
MVRWILRRCVGCGKYTMHVERCPHCGKDVKSPHPAKYSPDDKYIKYRLKSS